ncbi:Clr5 domain-containing protein [Xylariomycetidae sp. FL0641]|nr:Clr5 domain-containing protein [Xylariomycetidae sp. FL0641]
MATKRRVSKRKHPAKRIGSKEWNRYKSTLADLYKKQSLPLPEVMEVMERDHNFKATIKQYRYRFGELWQWFKYNHGNDRTRGHEVEIDHESPTAFDDEPLDDTKDFECSVEPVPTPPCGSDDDQVCERDIPFLKTELLSIISDEVIDESESLAVVEELEVMSGLQVSQPVFKKKLIEKLSQRILPANGSINVLAYHRLSSSLRLTIEGAGVCPQHEDSEITLTDEVFKNQPWYVEPMESCRARQCLQACVTWCARRICATAQDFVLPAPFNTLAEGHTDNEEYLFGNDVCLFVYLWDAWVSQAGCSSRGWESEADGVLGIPPAKVLRTVSSLILAAAGPGDPPSLSPSSAPVRFPLRIKGSNPGCEQLFSLAKNGVQIIQRWDKRDLVVEFIREFVYMYDPRGIKNQRTESLKTARKVAEEYLERKWPETTPMVEDLHLSEDLLISEDQYMENGTNIDDSDLAMDTPDEESEVSEEE